MYRKVSVEIEGEKPVSCASPGDLAIHKGAFAVLESRGVEEFGKIIDWEDVEEEMPQKCCVPKVVRQATLQDQSKADENALRSRMAREKCQKVAGKLDLQLHLIQIRYNFDRSVLHIVFTSEQNIDTQSLVSGLADELHVRIDIQQIGVRDEAGIVGGMGPCGRALCCCTWLSEFESINVKMAKAQRISLNPSTMSGMCGRLKCCLRYEYDQYRECSRHLPRNGAHVEGPDGKGVVIGTDILSQKVRVQLDEDRILTYDADDLREAWGREDGPRRSDHENRSRQRPEPRASR
jgi:cell fate regulator YaaT (PSP1 superfamily)